MKRLSSISSLFLASTMLCGLAVGASAQELLTADRIGLADAPKSMTFRTNPPFTHTSPTPGQAEGF
jgi:multiple sugar transport system substrate-binding protein